MNDVFIMSLLQSLSDLHGYLHGLIELQRLGCNFLPNAFSIEVGHGDKGVSVSLVNFVYGTNVRMVQSGRSLRFMHKPRFLLLASHDLRRKEF